MPWVESQDFNQAVARASGGLPRIPPNDYLLLTNQGKTPILSTCSLDNASGKECNQNVLLGPGAHPLFDSPARQAAGLAGSYGGLKISCERPRRIA